MRQPIKFGKYVLLERIAVGGMAEVYAAKAFGAHGFERILAIKRILPTMGEDPEFIQMFVDEARIAVQLQHANIVQVFELGKHDDRLYIAMEYVSGRDVRQLVDRFRKSGRPMPVAPACFVVSRVCDALDYAHEKRDAAGAPLAIVHRDVSPQNVLVAFDGDVKLIDFGIAKAEMKLQRTQTGTLKGKFSYMSPEQVKGLAVDGRSDVFAAGVLLWELLCGQKLFAGDSDLAVLEKVRKGDVPAPRSLRPDLPEELEAVVLKALASDRAARHQRASDLHDDLARFSASGGVHGPRQLAAWMREEFRAEYEKEQARFSRWLSAGAGADVEATPPRSARRDAPPGGGLQLHEPAAAPRTEPEVLVQTPTPASATNGAGTPPFAVSGEQTKAVRAQRRGALTRPDVGPRGRGGWFVGGAVAFAIAAATALAWAFAR